MIVNLWLAIRDDAQALIVERLTWDEEAQGEYSGVISDRLYRLFSLMADRATVQNIFRVDPDTQNWIPWNIYFNFKKQVLLKIKAELDDLIAAYPNHVRIGGAWHFEDGRQVGTQFTYDADGVVTGITGTPVYPLHPRLIEFMPDIVTRDAEGVIISSVRPTDLSDVNLLQGQQERRFV